LDKNIKEDVMSGHSKWKTNKGKKGIADAKRGATFTKIIKELVVVARDGGGNPDSNPRLRAIMEKAKKANMPSDNVKMAIKRGTGELPGVVYESVMYEAYGPGGVAIMIDSLTDNKNRTTAEAYNGPSIIMCYAPCIAHGIDMMKSQAEQKRAVDCGYWPLYRYNPMEQKPFKWECKEPTGNFQEFIRSERRYTSLLKTAPNEAEALFKEAEEDAKRRMSFYQKMGEIM
jgi:hypothetical protein